MTDEDWSAVYDDLYEEAKRVIAADTGNQGAWYLPPWIYVSEDGTVRFIGSLSQSIIIRKI